MQYQLIHPPNRQINKYWNTILEKKPLVNLIHLLHNDSYMICIYTLYILYTNLRSCMDNCFCLLWVNPVMSKKNDHIWGSYLMRVEALTRHKTAFFNMLLIKKRGYVCWKKCQHKWQNIPQIDRKTYKHAWIKPKKKYNMGVSKNGGFSPKMDGENNGTPY